MNINENLEMEKIIEGLKEQNTVPTLLLHSCCGPCSSCVIERLADYFKITVYYYNPNIFPEEEYLKRKKVQLDLINQMPTKNKVDFLDCDYQKNDFDEAVKGYEGCKEGEERCYKCYDLRIRRTGEIAKEKNFDFFTTTLSVSPHKNSKWINEIGRNVEKDIKVKYLPADFKKKEGYKRSIELSCKYGLYRQNYCGCVYSKFESEVRRGVKTNEESI